MWRKSAGQLSWPADWQGSRSIKAGLPSLVGKATSDKKRLDGLDVGGRDYITSDQLRPATNKAGTNNCMRDLGYQGVSYPKTS